MFTIDHFCNPEPLSIYLAKPSGELVKCIDKQIDENNSSLSLGINQQYELNFTVYRDSAEDPSWYDHLQEGMYLFVEKIGLFKMKQPGISLDGVKESKTVTAYSCDVELEDKNCRISINMGTETSQEYLVKYDENETEELINPYTGIPYDWIVLYNTFPEQLQETLEKYVSGYYGTTDTDGNIKITDSHLLTEVNELFSLIPRLKSRLIPYEDESGRTDYTLEEYVIYEYDQAGETVISVTLTSSFSGRIRKLISYYARYRNQLSLLSLILQNTGGSWSVGEIYGVKNGDYTLSNKKYQFETDGTIYSFLTQTLPQTSNCIVHFDLFSRKVNVTPAEYIGKPTGIVMSYDTLMNSMDISCNEDTLCTRLFVTGADHLGIEQVNFGLPYIDDITYKLNARDSSGRRIYVSDELAEKYMQYIDFRESKRTSYIQHSKKSNSYTEQIYELKYRVPNDDLKTDWGTYTSEELHAALKAYKNLLAALIALYKEDYGTAGLNKDGSVSEKYIRKTIYWYDYETYCSVIKEIECAIATFPYYSKPEKWTSENLEKYQSAISAWETDWSLYGSIELQAKIDTYTQNMKLLSQSSVVKISPDSDTIKTWDQLGKDERTAFGNLESNYRYGEYMENYRNRESAKRYLDDLLGQIADLEELQDTAHKNRLQTASEAALENYFTEDECRTLSLLYRDSSYSNENILTTSLDNTISSVDVMYELLQDGKEQLPLLSRPQLTFRISSDNLLGLPEFENLWRDFQPGNYMLIQYRDDTYVKLRMTGYTFNPCLPSSEDFTIVFSNYVRSKTKVSDLESLLGLSSASSSGSGNSKSSGGSGGSYGKSDNIDVAISNTMLSKLLNSETFGTRVTNVVLDTLDVNTLTAQSATFGGLADGSTTVNGRCITTGYIKDSAYNLTGEKAGTIDNTSGSIINLDTGKFSFGGGKLKWDGKLLTVTGKIQAASGYIGSDTGFYIGSKYLRNGDIPNAENTGIAGVYIGTDGFNVSGGTPSTTSYFTKSRVNIGGKLTWNGSTLSVNGKVTTGELTATGGKIANFRISNGFLYNDVPIGTAGSCGISCGTALGGSDNRIFWAGDETFRVDKNGALYAANADVHGNITASSLTATTSGTIACWNINSSSIYRNHSVFGTANGMYFGVDGLSVGANFKVGASGTLNCSGANITGNITSDNLTVKNHICLYADDDFSDINSKCKIIYFHNYDNAVGGHYYELVIGKKPSILGSNEFSGLHYGRTKIPGILNVDNLSCDKIDGKTRNTNNDYKVPISSSRTESHYTDTISTTSDGIIVYGNFENKDSGGSYIRTNKSFASSTSDQRLKTNIEDTSITNALEQILKIRHRKFDWINNNGHVDLGYIAQELEEINRSMVMKPTDDTMYYGINTFYLLGLVTKAIQELYEKIEEKESYENHKLCSD